MTLDLLLTNLLSPPVLFFFLGMVAVVVRSDLTIPEPLPKLFALYLLWAIGFKGGVSLRESGFETTAFLLLGAGVALSAITPIYIRPLLRLKFNEADACAVAAAYGSVSVVTFITAKNFIEAQGIAYSPHLVAALALMESPAIVAGVLLYNRRTKRDEQAHHATARELFQEAVFSGPVFLLLGSMAAGALSGPAGWATLRPFCEDIFHGVLVLFLLESGMVACRRLRELGGAFRWAAIFGVALPMLNAVIGLVVARLIGADIGDAFLFVILAASASYIAVPAAMRLAIPEANAGLYLPMALAISFPFNIALGIPLYLEVIRTLWPSGAP
ncbi:MAG: sodium-dependent bicarbonate transport family permease [Phycisphaerales bacterium]